MSLDRTPAQLASELSALSERNREITKEIQELKKERVFWRDTQNQVVQYEAAVDSLKKESQSLLSELVRLRRANDDLSRQLDRELEEHNDTKQRLNDTEAALRRAVLELKAKSKELEGRVSEFRSRRTSTDFDRADSPESLEINPSPPPSPRESYGISFTDAPYSHMRKASSAFSLRESKEENQRLRQTIEELQSALGQKDKQIRTMGREIIDYQRVLSTLMDDLERRDEQSMLGMEDENDGLGPLRSDDGFPVVQIISERGVRRIRSRLAFDDDEYEYADQNGLAPSNHLAKELAGMYPTPSSASIDSGVAISVEAEDEPPALNRHRSGSASSSVSNSEAFGASLADELEQLGQFDQLNDVASKDANNAKFGEAGFLKARLEAVGLNTTGNRKVLKKRLQAYINRKKKQLATSADPEKKLAALQTLQAARHH